MNGKRTHQADHIAQANALGATFSEDPHLIEVL